MKGQKQPNFKKHQKKPSHNCSVSKRVKVWKCFPFFSKPGKFFPNNPSEFPKIFTQNPPHHNGIKLYCEKLYECFLVFSDAVNCGQSASSMRLSLALKKLSCVPAYAWECKAETEIYRDMQSNSWLLPAVKFGWIGLGTGMFFRPKHPKNFGWD
jgi:hypothetical protein